MSRLPRSQRTLSDAISLETEISHRETIKKSPGDDETENLCSLPCRTRTKIFFGKSGNAGEFPSQHDSTFSFFADDERLRSV